MQKSADAYRTISEVATDLKLPQHVLRFWETRFPQVKPMKRGGNRRFYRPEDVDLLRAIRILLYDDGYTIKGVQRILKEQGPRAVTSLVQAVPRAFPTGSGELQLQTVQRSGLLDELFEVDQLRETDSVAKTVGEPFRTASPAASEPHVDRPHPASATQEPAGPPHAVQANLIEGLQAVLAELVECERILAAARR
ncbi:MAG TPA: MerR family transcriptional regulator [Lichenihabitans sp.]|nr:MerR family transcriptional regulator [Lichenihabitans sp.]